MDEKFEIVIKRQSNLNENKNLSHLFAKKNWTLFFIFII